MISNIQIMFKDIINKKIETVSLSKDKEKISFIFKDKTSKLYHVEGDCCSNSWIEHLEVPNNIKDAVIIDVQENSLGTIPANYEFNEYNVIKKYSTIFKTSKGDIVLEYRNSSNGYYGGYLVDSDQE